MRSVMNEYLANISNDYMLKAIIFLENNFFDF